MSEEMFEATREYQLRADKEELARLFGNIREDMFGVLPHTEALSLLNRVCTDSASVLGRLDATFQHYSAKHEDAKRYYFAERTSERAFEEAKWSIRVTRTSVLRANWELFLESVRDIFGRNAKMDKIVDELGQIAFDLDD